MTLCEFCKEPMMIMADMGTTSYWQCNICHKGKIIPWQQNRGYSQLNGFESTDFSGEIDS